MKNTLISLSATALLAMGSAAVAEETQGPIAMTDAQMDNIIAGGGPQGLYYLTINSNGRSAVIICVGNCYVFNLDGGPNNDIKGLNQGDNNSGNGMHWPF